jgi:hypothetical protein
MNMSTKRVDPMESWGKVRVDALELQDPCVERFLQRVGITSHAGITAASLSP